MEHFFNSIGNSRDINDSSGKTLKNSTKNYNYEIKKNSDV